MSSSVPLCFYKDHHVITLLKERDLKVFVSHILPHPPLSESFLVLCASITLENPWEALPALGTRAFPLRASRGQPQCHCSGLSCLLLLSPRTGQRKEPLSVPSAEQYLSIQRCLRSLPYFLHCSLLCTTHI